MRADREADERIGLSVDPDSIKLLQFEVGAYRLLTNKDPLPYHDGIDWAQQTQHVFRDNLRLAAGRLITVDKVVMDYSEFRAAYPNPRADDALAPVARIFDETGDSLRNNPVFWLRVVGYAYACQQFIAANDTTGSFTNRPVDVPGLLADLDDPYIPAHVSEQTATFDKIIAEGL